MPGRPGPCRSTIPFGRPRARWRSSRPRSKAREPIFWDGTIEDAWLVVYRSDSGQRGRQRPGSPRGKLWVRRDGAVLRQEAMIFDSTVAFVRLTDEESAELTETAARQWWSMERKSRAKSHD